MSVFRWRVNDFSTIVYKRNSDTVTFYNERSRYGQRLTITWEQFNNLHDVIDVHCADDDDDDDHSQSGSYWDLGCGLWLIFLIDQCVRLQFNNSRRQHSSATRISTLSPATTPFFEFDSVGWRKYKLLSSIVLLMLIGFFQSELKRNV